MNTSKKAASTSVNHAYTGLKTRSLSCGTLTSRYGAVRGQSDILYSSSNWALEEEADAARQEAIGRLIMATVHRVLINLVHVSRAIHHSPLNPLSPAVLSTDPSHPTPSYPPTTTTHAASPRSKDVGGCPFIFPLETDSPPPTTVRHAAKHPSRFH